MDLSHLSDEQLQAIASGKPQTPDLSMMSDEDLQKIATQGPSDIVQEMHPEFSTADRLIVKNLSNNNEAAVNYLQKQHPDLEVKVDDFSGQILARKRDGSERSYKVLDPDTGFFSKDILNDTGDVLGDVASGIGTTAATAAGGLVGGLPGAAGLGAVTSGGLEAIRQYLGQAAGVNKDVDNTQVGLATAAGGVSPLLFGSGATATQVAEKSLNPFAGALSTLKGEAAPALDEAGQALMKQQSGVLGRGYDLYKDKVAPKLGSIVSGANENAIRTMRANPKLLDEFDQKGALNFADSLRDEVKGAIKDKSDVATQAISDLTFTADDTHGLLSDALGTGDPEHISMAMGALKKEAQGVDPALLEQALQVDASKAKQPFLDLRSHYEDLISRRPTPENQEKLQEINQILDQHFGKDLPDRISAKDALQLKQDLGNLGQVYKTNQGTASRVASSNTQADKQLIAKATEASKALGDEIDRVTGLLDTGHAEGVSLPNQAYSQIQKDRKYLNKFFKDDESTYRNLSKVTTSKPARETVARIDRDLGTNLVKQADELSAYKAFSKNPFDAVSSGGTTSTSRTVPLSLLGGGLGYYLGAQSGLGQGGAGVGAGLGAFLGGKIGSPAALRAYMALQRGASAAGNAARDSGLKPAQLIPWLLMNNAAKDHQP